ncbi:MAG TPA: hypothetical protein VHS53_09250, partial [Mucilaginibacter sp.]|nr:hypothetical protein [Mucilaginibacter sp.]
MKLLRKRPVSDPVWYSFKVWITAVLTAPVLFFSIGVFDRQTSISEIAEVIPIYLLFAFVEFIFSILTWVAFWMTIELIVRIASDNLVRKMLISMAGIILTTTTFLVFPFVGAKDFASDSIVLIL